MKPDLNKGHFKSENPFKVPEGYFDSLEQRMMDRIKNESAQVTHKTAKITLRPYLTLAASISGIALITYLVINSLPGRFIGQNDYYDIELLDNSGIIHDESVMADSYESFNESSYTDWEKDVMNYLASNEVNILLLLE